MGLVITQPEDIKEKNKGFICPNSVCGKTFRRPLKASNLNSVEETYSACPYCLTEIPLGQAPVSLTEAQKNGTIADKKTISVDSDSKLSDCKNYLGYLSERAGKEIPDECLMCKAIVQCMLKSKEKVGIL